MTFIPKEENMEVTGSNVVYSHPDITWVVEALKNKFYFATLSHGRREARNTPKIHLFSIDNELIYNNFYNDFGPLNLACLYKYCCKVNKKLKNPANKYKQIVHYTSGQNQQKRANAAFLFTAYAILYLKRNPKEVYANLIEAIKQPLKPFQDASMGVSNYNIRLQDCLNAIQKAQDFGFFNFEDFDLAEYEKYEKMRFGDINWMIPQKFLAFTGPSTEIGTVYHPPEHYIDYFLKNNVIAVVRLNRKSYDAERFTRVGISHYDMFMPDGSTPPRNILNEFLQLAENSVGPIAVHCKAGLGRTGSLIAAYMVKHYRMTAREAIAWLRICRPGSVIGHQQAWLENMENELWKTGQQYRLKHNGDTDVILRHRRGIYSIADKFERRERIMSAKNNVIAKVSGKTCCSIGNNEKPRSICNEADKWVAAKKLVGKPGIASIFAGKFRGCRQPSARETTDCRSPELTPKKKLQSSSVDDKYEQITNKNNRTQGDRLTEIKANRNKFVRL